MSEWVAYNGSDEQDDEIENAKNGYILRCLPSSGNEIYETPIMFGGIYSDEDSETFTSKIAIAYWIIPDDPLREMKIRQAMTGQPVWYKHRFIESTGECGTFHHPFIQPETYEYSFTAFEE